MTSKQITEVDRYKLMQTNIVVPTPLPELYAKIHGPEQETTITEAGNAVLSLLDRIRQAECNPREYHKFQMWQQLQKEVDWIYDENTPVPGSDPETTAVAQLIVNWMKGQYDRADTRP